MGFTVTPTSLANRIKKLESRLSMKRTTDSDYPPMTDEQKVEALRVYKEEDITLIELARRLAVDPVELKGFIIGHSSLGYE